MPSRFIKLDESKLTQSKKRLRPNICATFKDSCITIGNQPSTAVFMTSVAGMLEPISTASDKYICLADLGIIHRGSIFEQGSNLLTVLVLLR